MATLRTAPVAVRVIAVGASVAGTARILVTFLPGVHGFWARIGLVAVGIVLAAPAILLCVGISALYCDYFVRLVRQCAPAYPAEFRRAVRWFALFLLVLALFVAATLVWRGHVLGTVAWVVVRLLLAVGFGGGTVVLALWPYFLAGTGRRRWIVAVAGLVWGGGGMFLFATGQNGLGIIMVFSFGGVLFKFVQAKSKDVRAGRTHSAGGPVALMYLMVFGLAWLRLATDPAAAGMLARWAGEAALVAVIGTATATTVWHRSRGARPSLRRIGTAGTIAVCAYLLFLLFDDQVFGGLLAVALFPLLVWQAIRLWRWMGESRRVTVKAGTDIVFALALGSTVVLFLIWLANLLALPPVEVSAIKGAASTVGDAVELPPWLWAGVYAALAAAYLFAAVGPRRFQVIPRRLAAAHVLPTVTVARRTLTMTGIGVMVFALLGLAVPPAVGPILARQIRDTYTVAAQEELEAEEASAVYQAVSTQFVASRPRLPVLTALMIQVHDTDPPDRRDGNPTPAELALAHRIGLLQGKLLAEPPGRAPTPPPTLHDADDLTTRLTEEQQQQSTTRTRQKQAETASELAAAAVTGMLDLVSLGDAEALGIVHEYLDGLAESPLGEVFLSWAQRAVTRFAPREPPTLQRTVEPDPDSLANAARADLFETELDQNAGIPPIPETDGGPEPVSAAVAAVVHSENQAARDHQNHSCAACIPVPGEGGGHDEEPPPEEHVSGE